jgi:hypothetical protein
VERAEKANAEALALLESIVAAKTKVDDLLPACVARLEALASRRGQAVRAVELPEGETKWVGGRKRRKRRAVVAHVRTRRTTKV